MGGRILPKMSHTSSSRNPCGLLQVPTNGATKVSELNNTKIIQNVSWENIGIKGNMLAWTPHKYIRLVSIIVDMMQYLSCIEVMKLTQKAKDYHTYA